LADTKLYWLSDWLPEGGLEEEGVEAGLVEEEEAV